MKLFELGVGRPERIDEPIGTYQRRLGRGRRIKKVGTGAFSRVYQHPKYDKIVVKVSQSGNNASLLWLKYVVKHQSNPYVPKVYGIRRFTPQDGYPEDDDYYVVFLEKLTPWKKLSQKEKKAILLKHFGEMSSTTSPNDPFDYLVSIVDELDEDRRKTGVPNKQMVSVLRFLDRHQFDHGDLHSGNVMVRGDTPVITDPFA